MGAPERNGKKSSVLKGGVRTELISTRTIKGLLALLGWPDSGVLIQGIQKMPT